MKFALTFVEDIGGDFLDTAINLTRRNLFGFVLR